MSSYLTENIIITIIILESFKKIKKEGGGEKKKYKVQHYFHLNKRVTILIEKKTNHMIPV